MSTDKVYIGDLPSAVVFAALYNNALTGNAKRRTQFDEEMTIEKAQSFLNDRKQAAFVLKHNGRVIGVDFTEVEFDPRAYNDTNQDGLTAQEIVEIVRDALKEPMTKATADFRTAPVWQ